jgi:hypothetical protein
MPLLIQALTNSARLSSEDLVGRTRESLTFYNKPRLARNFYFGFLLEQKFEIKEIFGFFTSFRM